MDVQLSNPNLIILLGYMGCGKSTIGQALATAVDYSFVDLDQFLEQKHKRTVPELFKSKGVKAFRDLEHLALVEALETKHSVVLSLGGGTPCYYNNMHLIKKATHHVFYLEASAVALATRLFPHRSSRPLIAHIESEKELKLYIAKHLFERNTFYAQATHTVDVSTPDVAQVVSQIKKLL